MAVTVFGALKTRTPGSRDSSRLVPFLSESQLDCTEPDSVLTKNPSKMRSAIIAITLLLHLSCHFQSVVGFPINLWKNPGSAQDMNVYVPVSAPPPALSMEHESKKFKIQIYSDKSCETYSATFEGEIENGQEENVDTPKGKCLWFVLPFPSGCKLHLERKTGQIQQFGREYSAGTMLSGSFERIGIKCG